MSLDELKKVYMNRMNAYSDVLSEFKAAVESNDKAKVIEFLRSITHEYDPDLSYDSLYQILHHVDDDTGEMIIDYVTEGQAGNEVRQLINELYTHVQEAMDDDKGSEPTDINSLFITGGSRKRRGSKHRNTKRHGNKRRGSKRRGTKRRGTKRRGNKRH